MRKFLIATAAFLVSAFVGVVLLFTVAYGWFLITVRSASGIGAVAGGVSEAAVTLFPVLCGALGAVLAVNRLNHPRP